MLVVGSGGGSATWGAAAAATAAASDPSVRNTVSRTVGGSFPTWAPYSVVVAAVVVDI